MAVDSWLLARTPFGLVLAAVEQRIERIADWVRARERWSARFLALGAGVASALALAPTYLIFLPPIAFPVLVWLIDGAASTVKQPWLKAAWIGWFFGYGFFLTALYWVGIAFTVNADAHAWMIPFVAVLFPGALAVYPALAFAGSQLLWSQGYTRVVVFAALFCIAEWLRGNLLSGFPWGLLGYSWAFSDAMMQAASILGVYGLTFLTVLAAASPAVFGDQGTRKWVLPSGIIGVLALLLVFGLIRLGYASDATVDGVRLRIVQPNTAQQDKYVDDLVLANWQTLLDLTRRPGLEGITHVIWPEAAPPFVLSREPVALEMIADLLPDSAVLLTGAVRAEVSGRERSDWYNSMHAVSGTGQILATYDKAHLVPFGEYLPLDSYLEWLGITKIVQVAGRFGSGPGPRTLSIPGAPPVGPLICYEIIFPAQVIGPGQRPQWLLNQTDDSWFGDTSGPRQHLVIARMRAIEEGLPVVRAANTGISTVIDAYGRASRRLLYGTRDTLDALLPAALPPTVFSMFGNLTFGVIVVLTLVSGLLLRRRTLSSNPQAGRGCDFELTRTTARF